MCIPTTPADAQRRVAGACVLARPWCILVHIPGDANVVRGRILRPLFIHGGVIVVGGFAGSFRSLPIQCLWWSGLGMVATATSPRLGPNPNFSNVADSGLGTRKWRWGCDNMQTGALSLESTKLSSRGRTLVEQLKETLAKPPTPSLHAHSAKGGTLPPKLVRLTLSTPSHVPLVLPRLSSVHTPSSRCFPP
jgi:hypothetical protein